MVPKASRQENRAPAGLSAAGPQGCPLIQERRSPLRRRNSLWSGIKCKMPEQMFGHSKVC